MSDPSPIAPSPPRDSARLAAAAVQALALNRTALALQPIANAADRGRIAFHEGLLRLYDAAGELLPTGPVFAALEDGPMGRALDRRALGLGLDQLRSRSDLRLSLNLSAQTLTDGPWWSMLDTALDADATLGERLILEITETAAPARVGSLAAFAEHWHSRGVSLALDDFGAGHTGFSQLAAIRWDIVKIDGALCAAACDGDARATVLEALVDLAGRLEMMSVAERIESAVLADRFTALGVDALQGYHIGRPEVGAQPQGLARPA